MKGTETMSRQALILLGFIGILAPFAYGYQCQDYGALIGSPDGVRLTQEEHPSGWRRQDCIICHPIRNIHCDDEGAFLTGWDMEWVRGVVESRGEKSCSICHGDNGAGPSIQ
jgi:hypothetical protein